MKRILYLLIIIFYYGCSSDDHNNPNNDDDNPNDEIDVILTTSIINPVKDRDYSYHNSGTNGVFEDPNEQKNLKGKIQISQGDVSNDDINIKWKSNIDGILFEGTPNENFESEINVNLSKGLHKVFFETYLNNSEVLIAKDSLLISNIITLEAFNDSGRSVKLNWTKYEGDDFLSYLVYGESFQPIVEIYDIDTLEYEYFETVSLIEERNYQVVVKTSNASLNGVLGSNLVSKASGVFIEIPYFIHKTIKDTNRNKIYAILDRSNNNYSGLYGLMIINSETLEVEEHILTDKKISDLDISPDNQYLYLTQRYFDEIIRFDLNDYSFSTITTSPINPGWGYHKIEVTNDNTLLCHVTPPTSGSSDMHIVDAFNGEILNIPYTGIFRHGDIEFNNATNKLYNVNSNTTDGRIRRTSYQNGTLVIDYTYPEASNPLGITYPYGFLLLSDDNNSIFWENFQFNEELQVVREFDTRIIACSPNKAYLSDSNKVFDYNSLSVIFDYPPFPQHESYSVLFVDDNTIVTNRNYRSSVVNYPPKAYFFKFKIN